MEYIGVNEAAQKWGLTPRSVQILCAKGRIEGANDPRCLARRR